MSVHRWNVGGGAIILVFFGGIVSVSSVVTWRACWGDFLEALPGVRVIDYEYSTSHIVQGRYLAMMLWQVVVLVPTLVVVQVSVPPF